MRKSVQRLVSSLVSYSLVMSLALVTLAMGAPPPKKTRLQDATRHSREAAEVFTEIMNVREKAIPKELLDKAEAIAVFPDVVKAAFIIGGKGGQGLISRRTNNGWSAPAFLTLIGGTFGLQIGGQSADIILVINNQRGLENLVSNQFKIGADASIAAGPVGRDAQAATDIQLRAQILSYSRARGLFAGVTVNGSTIRQDMDANERFYGSRLTTRQVVFEGKAGAPAPVEQWRAALAKYAQ